MTTTTTKATLITYSQPPVEALQEGYLTDSANHLLDWVAYCARVSNPANQANKETSERLVRYLANHKHWSPFEMVSVCMEVVTTRDIARQLLRHRSFSFQEFSQRYAEVSFEEEAQGFVVREARLQDWTNRQNSVDLPVEEEADALRNDWNNIQKQVAEVSHSAYQWALNHGVAKEVARTVLPEGMTPSRLYVNGTLRSWIHYIELRSDHGTQKEHRELALACAAALEPVFPMIREFIMSD